MARRRPTAVSVMAILNIIFGSLGLLLGICSGFGMLLIASVPAVPLTPGGPPVNITKDLFDFMEREIPGYNAITIAQLVIGYLLLSGLLLAAGIGLLNRQHWARIACIVYGAVNIVLLLMDLVFKLAFVMPAMTRWQMDFQRRFAGPNPFTTNPFLGGSFQIVTAAITSLICIGYSALLITMMFLPQVRYWFERRPAYDFDRDEDRFPPRERIVDEPWGTSRDDDAGYYRRKGED